MNYIGKKANLLKIILIVLINIVAGQTEQEYRDSHKKETSIRGKISSDKKIKK